MGTAPAKVIQRYCLILSTCSMHCLAVKLFPLVVCCSPSHFLTDGRSAQAVEIVMGPMHTTCRGTVAVLVISG